jgi:G:T-mismatch repair DNA endonuclease (very short patch repair protein)
MIRLCPFCEKVVGNDPHIYFCKSKTTIDKKEIKFLFLQKNFPLLSEKDFVEKVYKNKSLPDIKNEFGIDFKSFTFLLDFFEIKKRNISESSKLISGDKYRKTCNKRYGVDNVSKSDLIKNKKKDTFIKNYGVDNIFKDDKFKLWISENNFAWNNLTKEQNEERCKKQTISINKYWSNLTDEQKNKIFNHNGTSSLESKISEVLNFLSISHTTQFLIKGKIFDFKISNTNILIEVNGDYWHCNPKKYKVDESVKFPGGVKRVIDIWKKDENKKSKAEKEGYKVIYIWEDEIKKGDLYNLVLSKLNI